MEYPDIRKVIESCHLNFLIGSGASKPYFETLNHIEAQLTELASKDDISDDERVVIEVSIKQFYFESCIEGNLSLMTARHTELQETQSSYDAFLAALHTILSKRRSNLVTRQVNMFTTNMDIFLDWSLEKLQLSFNDGFIGRLNAQFGTANYHNIIKKTSSHYDYQSEVPLFNLFKLHGSVNWLTRATGIGYDYELKVLQQIKSQKVPTQYLAQLFEEKDGVQVVRTINQLKAWLDDNQVARREEHDKFLTAYGSLLMINPTKEKFETTTRDLTFYELLRMYSNHLERENSVLFVLGFSFADEHIREITKRVAIANPTLLIIVFAYSKAAKESIEKLLPPRPNIKYIFDSGGNEGEPIFYDLKTVTGKYFERLASELEHGKVQKASPIELPTNEPA